MITFTPGAGGSTRVASDNLTTDYAVELLASMPGAAFILNHRRELLAANPAFAERFLGDNPRDQVGSRPGEILQCVHTLESVGGCGTTKACAVCGLLRALVQAAGGEMGDAHCTITRRDDQPELQLEVRTRPLDVGGERYLIVSVA